MEEGQSLRLIFEAGEKKKRSLDDIPERNSSEYQNTLLAAFRLYKDASKVADSLSLYSPNETLDDISTSNLQYLLIDYHLAELLQQFQGRNRKAQLHEARSLYEAFLQRLDNYGMLSATDARLLETYEESPNDFLVTANVDPAARRDSTIARYKLSKSLQQKLEYLRNATVADRSDGGLARQLHHTNILLCVHETFQALQSIAQELKILALAPASEDDDARVGDINSNGSTANEDGYSDKLDFSRPSAPRGGHTGPMLSKEGKPLRPFTLLDKRQRLQEGVFRPDYNLPTMTIDEYLEEERRRGGIIDGGGEKSAMREMVDEDDMNKADEETMKDRRWDDFKDENPKGAGNTLNRG